MSSKKITAPAPARVSVYCPERLCLIQFAVCGKQQERWGLKCDALECEHAGFGPCLDAWADYQNSPGRAAKERD